MPRGRFPHLSKSFFLSLLLPPSFESIRNPGKVTLDDAPAAEKKEEEKPKEKEKEKEKVAEEEDFFTEEAGDAEAQAPQQERPVSAPKKANLTTKTSAAPKAKPGVKKLGAVKAADVSFDELERQAKEEQQAREKLLQQGIISTGGAPSSGGAGGQSSRLQYQSADQVIPKQDKAQAENIERLGMGMNRLGFGSDGSVKVNAK